MNSGLGADELIHWILDNKLANMGFDKFLREQMVEITPLGIDINLILNKLKTTSEESEKTNIFAAEKLKEENEKWPIYTQIINTMIR